MFLLSFSVFCISFFCLILFFWYFHLNCIICLRGIANLLESLLIMFSSFFCWFWFMDFACLGLLRFVFFFFYLSRYVRVLCSVRWLRYGFLVLWLLFLSLQVYLFFKFFIFVVVAENKCSSILSLLSLCRRNHFSVLDDSNFISCGSCN